MPAVCRGFGVDVDLVHCSLPSRVGASTNVLVNGIGVSRQFDFNDPHLFPAGLFCFVHAAPISTGSLKVRVNGRGCGRVGDSVAGCTFVASGSFNVFAGDGII
jgi:uncharacterized Zn-binding protein involved in type VI secretion